MRPMTVHVLATPVAKTCDAGGGALRSRSGGSGQRRIIGRISQGLRLR